MLELFEATKFAEKADCLARRFERRGLNVLSRWQNAPAVFGGRVCGEDVYSVVAELNRVSQVDPQSVPAIEEQETGAEEQGAEIEAEEAPVHDGNTIFALQERGVSEEHTRALASAGVMTLEQARTMDKKELTELLQTFEGVGEKTAERIISAIGR